MKRQINVVGAVIVRDGRVLCAQRGEGRFLAGMWEFPGGKIEPGETPATALEREIREELDCEVRAGVMVESTDHEYPFGRINLTTLRCELVAGDPAANEHAALRWLAPRDLLSIDWAPADLPAVVKTHSMLTRTGVESE